jgi:hypothetical protein
VFIRVIGKLQSEPGRTKPQPEDGDHGYFSIPYISQRFNPQTDLTRHSCSWYKLE